MWSIKLLRVPGFVIKFDENFNEIVKYIVKKQRGMRQIIDIYVRKPSQKKISKWCNSSLVSKTVNKTI